MARTGVTIGFTVVGAAVGAYFGNPMLGAQLGMMVGSIAGALLFPGGEDTKGPRLGDLRVGDASYGIPIPIVYGAVRLAGIMIWTSGIEERSNEESNKGGGPTSTTYNYYSSFAIGLCEGPLANVRKIWLDTKLVYDMSSTNTGITNQRVGDMDPRGLLSEEDLEKRRDEIQAELANVQSALTIYLGTETQLPDPVMEAHEGIGEVPAHRGMAYLLFADLPLAAYGNRIPNVSAEVMTEEALAYPQVTVSSPVAMSIDQMVFDPSRQILWNLLVGNLTGIDGLTNTVIQSGPIDTTIAGNIPVAEAGIAVDQDGFLYVTLTDSGMSGQLARVDPVTLAVTHVNVDTFTLMPESLGPCQSIHVSQNFVWWTSFFFGQAAYCFLRPQAVSPQTGQPVLHMSETASVGYSQIQGLIGKFICTDRDDTAWIVCSGLYITPTGQTLLLHFQYTGAAEVFDISADVANGAWLAYDPQTHALLIQGTPPGGDGDRIIVRFDIGTSSITGTSGTIHNNNYITSAWRRGVIGREIWYQNGSDGLTVFDVDSLSIVREESLGTWGSGPYIYGGLYDPATHAFWQADSTNMRKDFLDRVEPQPLTLGQIVADLSRRAGLASTDVYTSALTQPVHGFAVSQRSEARASVETVMAAFLADGVETDWRVQFQHRAALPVATLTVDDLAAHEPGATLPDVLTPERLDDQQLPMRLDITYGDPARDYQDTVQHARRFQAGQRARSQREVRTPVILSGDQAKQLAEQSLTEAWVSRTQYKLSLPYRWSTLDPGDVLEVQAMDSTSLMRVQQIQHGANGILEVTAVAYDRHIYTDSPSVGVVADALTQQTITMNAPTGLFLMDTHLLRDLDEGSGYYMAMGPQGGGAWPGATAFSSMDGSSWRMEETITTPVDYGGATTVLEEGSPYVIDYGHTVDVRMVRGTLASISVAELLNGLNPALLGQEIFQWQTATALDANSWRLSNLLRGRKGTEWAISTHVPGERFVVLSYATLRREQMGLSEVGTSRLYRAVTNNTDMLTQTSQAFVNTALGLKCYSPEHLHGTRNTANDLTITWIRRTRLGGLWVDGHDALLGESSEAYEVDIVAAGVVVRNFQVTTQTVTYTAAQQTTDGATLGAPVLVRVSQMGVFGRGWPLEGTV